MKGRTFTQSMSWLHTWCGLLLGWVLFAIAYLAYLLWSFAGVSCVG